MELRQYATLVWRWLWLLALGALVAAGVAYYYSESQTPLYQASATLLISQSQNPAAPDYNALLTGEKIAATYSELLTKRPVLEGTITQLHLPYTPAQLAKMATVRVVRNTQLLEVSVEDPDPDMAAEIANALAATFIAQMREDTLGQTASYRDSLQQQLGDLEREMKSTSERIQQLRNSQGPQNDLLYLQGLLSQYQTTYAQLLRSDQDMKLAEAAAVNAVRVAEPAIPPTEPTWPKTLQNTLLAALVGLMLAVGAAFLAEYLDDTVKTPEDVEQACELPTLGNIIRFARRNGNPERLVSERDPKSPVAEAYRVLRTNVDFARVGHEGKTLLITSALEREGKSTTAANLAVMMALAGRSVILVDGDLRRPSVHRFFGLDNTSGLTSLLLRQNLGVEAALQATAVRGLRVLPSGPIPPNPAELLSSPRMGEIIEEAKALAEVILFDSPPLLAVSDPIILGSRLEGVALVVDAGRTRHGALERAVEALERGAVPILGVVLNKLSNRAVGGYYYYHYYSSKNRGEPAPHAPAGS